MALRRMAVGGRWYPAQPARLAEDVDRHVAAASVDLPHGRLRAIVVPHAGLLYSGPVAAFAYRAARTGAYRTFVLVGPSHFVPFHGVAIWDAGEWETPFGPIPVDVPLAQAVRAASSRIIDLPAAHQREHSLEMQLPFLAHLLPEVPIVPLVMGHQTRETAFALGEALAHAIASNEPNVLLIASSDLSHYEDSAVASQMDAIMMRHVDAFDPEGLMTALEHEPRHACGGGPMVSVLHAARLLGASSARVLCYADSGDVSGDKTAVVGYLAAAIQ